METDVSDYALTAIPFIVNEEKEVHLVAFHFHTFTVAELNMICMTRNSLPFLRLSKFGGTI